MNDLLLGGLMTRSDLTVNVDMSAAAMDVDMVGCGECRLSGPSG